MPAPIAQPRHGKNNLITDRKDGAHRQPEQIAASGRYVLAQGARYEDVACRVHLVVELGVHEMHLPQIRLLRIRCHATAMLHCAPRVRVTFDADTGEQSDRRLGCLAEFVVIARVHADDNPVALGTTLATLPGTAKRACS